MQAAVLQGYNGRAASLRSLLSYNDWLFELAIAKVWRCEKEVQALICLNAVK